MNELLTDARNYWVGTTRPDGRPHAVPVWGVWLAGVFYFATARGSRKGRNLAEDPRGAVHLESGDTVVILEGTVVEVTDPSRFTQFAEAYRAKYQWRPDADNLDQIVYALHPRVAFTWLERDYPQTAIRWQFDRP